MAFDSKEQRRIMGHFATGITVVTTRTAEGPWGMTANAVTSLSLDPPLILVAVDKRAHMHETLTAAGYFALNILAEHQEHLSQRFAQRGPKEFGDIPQRPGVTGSPIFEDALGYADCKVHSVLAGGDHDIFIGEIVAGDAREGQPLLYYRGKYGKLAT